MKLDLAYIIIGSLIILSLVPLYIYRKEIYAKLSKDGDLKFFLKDIGNYLSINYPKFVYNLNILEKLKDEKDIQRKEILILENIVRQFVNFGYELSTQTSIPKENLWSNYDANSRLIKDNKFPIDWAQRKEAAWRRDNGKCNRCGTKIKLENTQILLARQMKNGGGFNLENLVVLCSDCARIMKAENPEKIAKDLHIYDSLMINVEN
jgi:hypothetical protein